MTAIPTSGRLRPIRVLELRSVWGTGGGPDKTIIHGAARTDPARFAVTVCYLRDARDPAFGIPARATDLSLDYVEVVERHSFDPGVFSPLRKIVREKRIDIVHAHEYKTDLLALLLARAEQVRPLSTAHGWSGESRKERAYYFANKRLLAWFPRVVAVSQAIKDELTRSGCRADRVVVIQNGIDEREYRRDEAVAMSARLALGVAEGDVVLGAVGRLETVKCYDALIEAFAAVRQRVPGARLFIAGDGPCREALEAQVAALGLRDVCRLLGHRQDVKALYQAFDVFVQSSRSEGSPNAVLEAMALGTPIVATDVGGTRDLIDDGVHGLLVPPDRPDALLRGVTETISEPSAAAARAAAARRRVEGELSFDQRMRRLEAVYDAMMPSDFRGRLC